MTVERLRAVLNRVGPPGPGEPPVTPREIAEILWLAAHLTEERPAVPTASTVRTEGDDDATPSPDTPDEAEPDSPPVPARAPLVGPSVRRELHAPAVTSGDGDGESAASVLVPTAPMLDRPLAVQRALRPLKRHVPSRRVRLLDEHATAARIADRHLHARPWVPVMTAAPERWLSLVLVVDDGPSMRLWRPLARELHETLLRLGAFRDLRVCRLVGTVSGVGLVASPGGAPRDPATLVDPSGRQVVLVLSDCSGPYWWDGAAGRALHLWAQAGPAAILQPLAERLWRRTAAPTVPGTVVAARACAPNTALRFTPYDGQSGGGAVPVPVLECSPGWFADWATLVAGGGTRSAAMTYVGGRPAGGAAPVRLEHGLPIRERVLRFQATASREAALLAAHVAVSYPALPVMRLIQQRILGGARPGHLAEVLLSGLLRPVENVPDRYEFVAGAREALLATLPRSVSWHTADVLSRVSEEIERRAGREAEMFTAYLPAEDGDQAVGPDRPFALVSGEAVRLLTRTAPPRVVSVRGVAGVSGDPPESPESDGIGGPGKAGPGVPDAMFLRLTGIPDPAELDVDRLWARRGERDFLRVPFGEDPDGRPVYLDLKEAAQGGMGPHGLCIGATGSGKSELLRTLVLSIALTHPPDQVRMVLVDYKGGATFGPFEGLPHVAGMISNLASDPGLVERAHASLEGEVRRRQELLRDAKLGNIRMYAAQRASDPAMEPLPYLLVVVDEFTELTAARPEFVDLFRLIGRVGRATGVHLLLASQRHAGRLMHDLNTYFSYRLALRTFTEAQSQAVLGGSEAYHLPATPGAGYLQAGADARRFHAAYVSSPALPRASDPLLLEVMARQLVRRGEPYRRLWLRPLPSVTTLDAVCGPVEATGQGLRIRGDAGNMRVPLGLLDDPERHRQVVWTLDLTAKGGHIAVVGSPQSGKTTLLRTFVVSLALTHTPRQVAVYAIDLVSGTGMRPLDRLPHVRAVRGGDPGPVRRIVRQVREVLDNRQRVFRERGIESMERLRALHAAGQVPELPTADVVLVIDGIGAAPGRFNLDKEIRELLRHGGALGVHVVASMLRRQDVSVSLRPNFGTWLELHLNDTYESMISPERAATIRIDQQGRVLTDASLFAQVALPRIDGVRTASDVGEAIERTGEAVSAAWSGAPVPPVTVRTERLDAADLPSVAEEPSRVPIGRDVNTGAPVHLDLFGSDRGFLVLGDRRCGKTNLLRLIARGLVERHTPDAVSLIVMDPRGGLRDVVPDAYLSGYADSPAACAVLARRLTRMDATAAVGTVVLADDHDALSAEHARPFADLSVHIASSRGTGLHFVVARQATGAARALLDPFLAALSGTTGLVMDGDREEGRLLERGVYAAVQPPGRGKLVRGGQPVRTVQTALAEGADVALRPMPIVPPGGVGDTPVSRVVLVADIPDDRRRSVSERLRAHHDLQTVLDRCDPAVPGRHRWYRRRTDDGEVILLSTEADLAWFAGWFPSVLRRTLATWNAERPSSERLRLRVALHRGLVWTSVSAPPGLNGPGVDAAVRLARAADPPERAAADLVFVMSASFRTELLEIDPAAVEPFTRVEIPAIGDVGYLYEGE
jgi:type VII secretion protein EccCb